MIPPRNTCIYRKHSQACLKGKFVWCYKWSCCHLCWCSQRKGEGSGTAQSVVPSGTSPGRSVELRIKNYEQLRYLQQLYNDGILTAEEYHEQKQLIITSIRKLWAFIVNYTWIFDSYMCEIAFEKFIWVQSKLYNPGWAIQPWQSCGVILVKLVSCSVSPSVVPSPSKWLPRSDLTLEKASSMGLKSGEYGGRKRTSTQSLLTLIILLPCGI